jgi:hypothetical protein
MLALSTTRYSHGYISKHIGIIYNLARQSFLSWFGLCARNIAHHWGKQPIKLLHSSYRGRSRGLKHSPITFWRCGANLNILLPPHPEQMSQQYVAHTSCTPCTLVPTYTPPTPRTNLSQQYVAHTSCTPCTLVPTSANSVDTGDATR